MAQRDYIIMDETVLDMLNNNATSGASRKEQRGLEDELKAQAQMEESASIMEAHFQEQAAMHVPEPKAEQSAGPTRSIIDPISGDIIKIDADTEDELGLTELLARIEHGASDEEIEQAIDDALERAATNAAKDKKKARQYTAQLLEMLHVIEKTLRHSQKQVELQQSLQRTQELLSRTLRENNTQRMQDLLRSQQLRHALKEGLMASREQASVLRAMQDMTRAASQRIAQQQMNTQQRLQALNAMQQQMEMALRLQMSNTQNQMQEQLARMQKQMQQQMDPAQQQQMQQAMREMQLQMQRMQRMLENTRTSQVNAQRMISQLLQAQQSMRQATEQAARIQQQQNAQRMTDQAARTRTSQQQGQTAARENIRQSMQPELIGRIAERMQAQDRGPKLEQAFKEVEASRNTSRATDQSTRQAQEQMGKTEEAARQGEKQAQQATETAKTTEQATEAARKAAREKLNTETKGGPCENGCGGCKACQNVGQVSSERTLNDQQVQQARSHIKQDVNKMIQDAAQPKTAEQMKQNQNAMNNFFKQLSSQKAASSSEKPEATKLTVKEIKAPTPIELGIAV
jgi:hypothetical protein